jgi:hypothetical protein
VAQVHCGRILNKFMRETFEFFHKDEYEARQIQQQQKQL